MHVLVEFLCGCVFKDGGGVFFKVQGVFFAEWCAEHGASGLVETLVFDGYAWGAADNAAVFVDFDSLSRLMGNVGASRQISNNIYGYTYLFAYIDASRGRYDE